jgi:hypothetical protein
MAASCYDGKRSLRNSIVVGNAVAADIPTASETVLLLIAIMLGAAGTFVLRR